MSNELYGRKLRLFCIRVATEYGFVKEKFASCYKISYWTVRLKKFFVYVRI